MRVAVLPRHQEHLDNGQRAGKAGKAASTGKGGRPRIEPSDSTSQDQWRRNRRTWHLIQTSDLGTKFSFACSRLMNVLQVYPHAETHLKTQSNGENIGSPQHRGTVPMGSFPGKQLASQESCSPQRLSMSSHGQSLWVPSRVYKSTLMPAQKQLLPIL